MEMDVDMDNTAFSVGCCRVASRLTRGTREPRRPGDYCSFSRRDPAVGLWRGAADRVDDRIDLVSFAQCIKCGKGHADFGPQGADDELPAPGGADGLNEFDVLQELTVVRSSGLSSSSRSASSGSVGCPRPDATLTVECTTGTPNVLMVLTVETAFLSRSA